MIDHTHHWILPPPDGPKVTGKCECGRRKRFPSSMDLMTRTEYRFNRPLDDDYAKGVNRMRRGANDNRKDTDHEGWWVT
ncbi:hypothetical protein LCGC14_1788230 [marine sediment metagenome]|uniref:Uncharacterized protein n=1 Tax=marine sediment metagenome TaxID=412755 RepID=A0A0F9GTD4_9ZZZZ